MIIETEMYPADEPWLSLGYTSAQVISNTSIHSLAGSKLNLSDTLAQIDEFFHSAISQEPAKKQDRNFGNSLGK
jgi:hypothetical protein